AALATVIRITVIYATPAAGGGIAASSLGEGNLSVAAGTTVAVVTSYFVSGNTVTYTVLAPGGAWGASPQGTYTIAVGPAPVRDYVGNLVPAGVLGSFEVQTSAPRTPEATVLVAPVPERLRNGGWWLVAPGSVLHRPAHWAGQRHRHVIPVKIPNGRPQRL